MNSYWMRRLALALALLAAAPAAAQPAVPVIDLNTTRTWLSDPLLTGTDFGVLGTTVFFLMDDGLHGVEMWKTDGSAAGTSLVKDICPGSCWGQPFRFTPWNGALYFVAFDGIHGLELWVTDGSAAGTRRVTDLRPGLHNGVTDLLVAGSTLYLVGDDGVRGHELWKSDGTAAGTQLVADVNPGAASSQLRLWLDVAGKLLLSADDGVHGLEPWLSDGTAAGTALLKDVNPGPSWSVLGGSVGFENDALDLGGGSFLLALSDGDHGVEPWRSDGTAADTLPLADLEPGFQSSSPYGFTQLGSTVFFGAFSEATGWELWKTDGTPGGTGLFKDISAAFSSSPRSFTPFGGQIFFVASEDASGRELWKTDGTPGGTAVVKDVNPGTADGLSPFFRFVLRPLGTDLLFFADDGAHGTELFRSDGTAAGTTLVKDIEPGAVSGFALGYSGMTVVAGRAFFHARGGSEYEVWMSDGTAAGTAQLSDIATLTSSIWVANGFLFGRFNRFGGDLVFTADDGTSGPEPWRTDGSAAGTAQVADLNPGLLPGNQYTAVSLGDRLLLDDGDLWASDGTPGGTARLFPSGTFGASGLVASRGRALFTGNADTSTSDYELWSTDGTTAGTARIKEIKPGVNGSFPSWLTPLGRDLVLFSADDGISGSELWRTDGTAAGTVRVEDVRPGPGYANPVSLTLAGQLVFFFATEDTGQKLWASDGTEAGTFRVKDVQLSLATWSGRSGPLVAGAGSTFFFIADDGTTGPELWKSDGTEAGTGLVKDIFPGARSSEITLLTPVRNRLFFVADDGSHGRELWVSDGSTAGTKLVADLVPGPGSPLVENLAAVGHLLLFATSGDEQGYEPWKSDGTAAGTLRIQDIAPGPLPSNPIGFTSVGRNVYFAANDGTAGFELWNLPRAALGSTFTDVPVDFWAWPFVEALAEGGVTGGCGGGSFCPGQLVTRAEMAIFLLVSKHSTGYRPPPATGTRFADVPAGFWAGAWIEQLAAEGITGGCGGGNFCPGAPLTRAEMAIFLLLGKHGTGYTPPPATGTRFADVPPGYWAGAWIEQLAAEGVTSGCGGGNFCPTAQLSRAEMAVFLTVTFGLPVP